MSHPRLERMAANLLEPKLVRRQGFNSATLADQMRTHAVPGVSIAVIHDYAIEVAESFGLKEAGQPDPITPETMFQACSVSKPVTATAVMRLAQDGLLDLDEDVNRYLTSWKVRGTGNWQPKVTLRQLLSHSAGTSVHGFVGYDRYAAIPTLRQILDGEPPANTAPIRVDHLPGTRFRYSGGGFTVVQQLLEDVLKAPFVQIMADLVLRPLGMVNSTFAQPLPEAMWDRAASGHRIGGGVAHGKWQVHPETAAGGLWTTPTDLARLALDLQLARAGRPARLFTKAMADEMMRPNPGGWGIGFALDGPRFRHPGDNPGFQCTLVAYQDYGEGIVVMANCDEGWHVNDALVRAAAAEYQWPLSYPADFGFYPVSVPAPPQVAPEVLARYAGDYLLREDYPVKVLVQDDQLYIQAGAQLPVPMVAATENQFYCELLNMFAVFQHDGALTLYVAGEPFMCRRQIL